jgi:hypothetical protein
VAGLTLRGAGGDRPGSGKARAPNVCTLPLSLFISDSSATLRPKVHALLLFYEAGGDYPLLIIIKLKE